MSTYACPRCGSKNTYDSARCEGCNDCGHHVYYGDAHATGTAQISTIDGKPCGISEEEYDRMKAEEEGR